MGNEAIDAVRIGRYRSGRTITFTLHGESARDEELCAEWSREVAVLIASDDEPDESSLDALRKKWPDMTIEKA
jgi:hypothetical protein